MLQKRSLQFNISVILLAVSLVCFVIHFLFFRYSFPPINVDESSFFSPAYSFAKHGVLSSDIHQSFLPGSSKFTYWMPPLYLVILGFVLKVAGISVMSAKVLSMLFTCASAFFLSRLSKDKNVKFLIVALFLICPFIIITSAFIRVEALSILLIVLCITAVRFNIKEYWIGIIAGLGIMTHPLLMPAVAGLGIVVLRRGMKPFIIFSIVALITITPYLIYILKDLELFKEQMALQLSRKSKVKLSDLKASYLLQSVPFALIAWFCLYKVKQFLEFRLFLVISLTLSLIIVLRSNEFNYQVYLIPYVLASVAFYMQEQKEKVNYRFVLPVVLYAFFAVLLVSKVIKYHSRSDVEYKELIGYLSNNKSWNGKEIFVAGSPDIANYLLINDQQVERQIPIARGKSKDWFNKFNYVVEVTDNAEPSPVTSDSTVAKPWQAWKKSSFTTSKGSHSIFVYVKN